MCMSTTDFALEWNADEKSFVGYGWKKLENSVITKYKKNWQTAKFNSWCSNKSTNESLEYSGDNKTYPPGFHIFENKQDAVTYYSGTRLVKVMFKDVIARGTNETGSGLATGPCIIAKRMKLVEKYNDDGTIKQRL